MKKQKIINGQIVTKTFYSLGTIVRLLACGGDAETAIREAQERIFAINDKMSVFINGSEISAINANAGGAPQPVSDDTMYVIKKAVYYSVLSGGAFNPAIRPLVALWGIETDYARIPGNEEIKRILPLVDYRDITINDSNHTVKLNRPTQSIDLGGIAKGYAADEAAGIFRMNEVTSGIIDLGGNIYALGHRPDGKKWDIGIQNPLDSRGNYIGLVDVADKSVVTSGNYERFFLRNGKCYHHILDPRTGYPSESGIISATVVSDFSIDGDALSTCIFLLGLEEGMELIKALEGIECVIISPDMDAHVSSRQIYHRAR